MSQYYIKVRSCDTNQEPEWWSRQIVSPTQSNLFWNNGGVGIGVPNPLAKLQVDGNVGIGTAYAAIAPPIDGLIVSGNVGIGTANPTSSLHVQGTVKATAFNGDGSLLTGVSVADITGTLAVAKGGTNITSYAVGDIVYASGTTTLAKLADIATGNALLSGGVNTAPSWGKIGLTTHVTNVLPVANGGTGVTASTGTGNAVLSSVPTLTGPVLTSWALTAIQAGKLEYDGVNVYMSLNGVSRGILPVETTHVLSANRVLLNATGAQSFFPVAYTVASSTTYRFKAQINMARTAGTTGHTIGTSITGTATYTSVAYSISSTVASGGTSVMEWVVSPVNTTITGANTVASENNTFRVEGIARVNAGGTFNFQFTYSVAPGGAPTIQTNSFISFYPIGTNTVTEVGDTWV